MTDTKKSAPKSVTCPACGEEATVDLAPNPGPQGGGPMPPPAPPPEGMEYDPGNPPWATKMAGGAWYLIACPNGHATLWPEAALEELTGLKDNEPVPQVPGHYAKPEAIDRAAAIKADKAARGVKETDRKPPTPPPSQTASHAGPK